MAVIPDRDIQAALNYALAMAFPLMPIAWENTKYVPTVGTAYFRVWMLPAETDVITIGPEPWLERKGVFQVSVLYPIGVGFGPPKVKAAEVVAAFRANTSFTYNTLRVVIDKSWPAPGMLEDEGWYHIPVSVRYTCYYNL
jgi:hypothetical protein